MTVYDHTEQDKRPINWLSLTLTMLAIIFIGDIVLKRLSEIKEAAERELYIESKHSELK